MKIGADDTRPLLKIRRQLTKIEWCVLEIRKPLAGILGPVLEIREVEVSAGSVLEICEQLTDR